MIAPDIKCTYADGKTLEELSRLIERRIKATGEMMKDAVTAIAINVLGSLRSDTREYKGGAITPEKAQFVIEEAAQLYVGFDRSLRKRVVRWLPVPGHRFNPPAEYKIIWLVQPSDKMKNMRLFLVWYPDHIRERYKFQPKGRYFVALSRTAVEHWIENKFTKMAQRYQGLARYALTRCQVQLSTRTKVELAAGRKAKAVGDMHARVAVREGGKTFGILVSDALNYATKALKGGPGAVDTSMKKAANKVAGYITHCHHAKGDFIHDVPAPFPEIKRRRSA